LKSGASGRPDSNKRSHGRLVLSERSVEKGETESASCERSESMKKRTAGKRRGRKKPSERGVRETK